MKQELHGVSNNLSVDYSVVVPVFTSSDSLRELHDRLTAVFQDISPRYEIILVDDASSDNSWEIMQQINSEDHRVKIIQHMRNFGQHKATLCGLRHAKGNFIVTMDDDLQHPPEEIPKLVEAITSNESIDVAIGAYQVKQHSWYRNIASKLINATASYVFEKDLNLKLTSFRIMRRYIADELTKSDTYYPRIGQLLLTITNRIVNVSVVHHPRKYGRTGYTFRRLVSDTASNILGSSSLPLQIVSFIGFACSALSVILGVYVLCKYLFIGVSVSGWTSTMLVLLFFFGVLLFSFGIVGEYLLRILQEIKGTSRSLIRNKKL